MSVADILKDAEALAREWAEFSEEAHGWRTREYEGAVRVRCYFADGNSHRDVALGVHECQISVALFDAARFNDLTRRSAAALPDLLVKARALLDEERLAAAARTQAEIDAERQGRIERLRAELAELAGTDCQVCGEDHEGNTPLACKTGDGQ